MIEYLPTIPEKQRIELYKTIDGIDSVILQQDMLYNDVIESLHPDYIVHGDNWTIGVESAIRNHVKESLATYGGTVIDVPYTQNETVRKIDLQLKERLSMPEYRRKRLRQLISMTPIVKVMEARSGITGLIVEKTVIEGENGMLDQFDAMWISSLCDSTAKGKPDIELVDMTSRFRTIEDITEVTTKPIIFDGDTGGSQSILYILSDLLKDRGAAVIIEDKKGLKKNSLFGTEVKQTQATIEEIAANEGNAVGIAAGYHLATGKVPVVYMQNTGEGNVINPLASLLNDKVYVIPVIFIIGRRGEPGIHDEPQHIYQGKVTLKLLDDMNVKSFVIKKDTSDNEVLGAMEKFKEVLSTGNSAAFVICKGALTDASKVEYSNNNSMSREEIIRHIVTVAGEDPIISTTGKASRELFEIREANNQGHKYEFLTVGSMGHSSSIALGIVLSKLDKRIWCIDGDGAALMHMGAMAVIGANRPKNLIYIVINNGAQETVGGMPTVAGNIGLVGIAKACGYPNAVCVDSDEVLDIELKKAKESGELSFYRSQVCNRSKR